MSAAPERPDHRSITPIARAEILRLLDKQEAKGVETYGRSLTPFNGRDPYEDALEELVDAIKYVVQARLESAHLKTQRDAAWAAAERIAKGVLALEQYRFEPGEWRSCPMCNRWLEQHPEAGHTEDCELVPLLALAAALGEAPR